MQGGGAAVASLDTCLLTWVAQMDKESVRAASVLVTSPQRRGEGVMLLTQRACACAVVAGADRITGSARRDQSLGRQRGVAQEKYCGMC